VPRVWARNQGLGLIMSEWKLVNVCVGSCTICVQGTICSRFGDQIEVSTLPCLLPLVPCQDLSDGNMRHNLLQRIRFTDFLPRHVVHPVSVTMCGQGCTNTLFDDPQSAQTRTIMTSNRRASFPQGNSTAVSAVHTSALARHNESPATSATSSSSSIDPREAAKFAALSASWWDPNGPFAPLHHLNPARCSFIRGAVLATRHAGSAPLLLPAHLLAEPLRGLSILDVGCGGGILSESMARLGARVHGVDITHENVAAATQHAQLDPQLKERMRCVHAHDQWACRALEFQCMLWYAQLDPLLKE
jgi:hypothetical protein